MIFGTSLQAGIDYDGWLNIKIEHSLNCENVKYCSRGNISLKSIRAGVSVIDQIQFNKQHIEELKVCFTHLIHTRKNNIIVVAPCIVSNLLINY